jgi:hypothetical protein
MDRYPQLTSRPAACAQAICLFSFALVAAETAVVIAYLTLGIILNIRHFQVAYLMGYIIYPLIAVVFSARFFWLQYLLGVALTCVLVLFEWTSLRSWCLAAGAVLLTVPLVGPLHHDGLSIFMVAAAGGVALLMWRFTDIRFEPPVKNTLSDRSANHPPQTA